MMIVMTVGIMIVAVKLYSVHVYTWLWWGFPAIDNDLPPSLRKGSRSLRPGRDVDTIGSI